MIETTTSQLWWLLKDEQISTWIIDLAIHVCIGFDFQKIDDYMESPIKNVLFFREINTIFNSIFKKIMQPNRDSFNISFFSQLIYFYYFDNNVKVHFYSEFNNILKTSKINELDCFEKTFIKICIKKSKNLEYMKISKLEFIYKLILCMVFRWEILSSYFFFVFYVCWIYV